MLAAAAFARTKPFRFVKCVTMSCVYGWVCTRACVCWPLNQLKRNSWISHAITRKKIKNLEITCATSATNIPNKNYTKEIAKKHLHAVSCVPLFTHPPISMAKTRKFGQTIVFEMPLKRLREHERKSIYIYMYTIYRVCFVLGRAAGFCAKLLSDAINVD